MLRSAKHDSIKQIKLSNFIMAALYSTAKHFLSFHLLFTQRRIKASNVMARGQPTGPVVL